VGREAPARLTHVVFARRREGGVVPSGAPNAGSVRGHGRWQRGGWHVLATKGCTIAMRVPGETMTCASRSGTEEPSLRRVALCLITAAVILVGFLTAASVVASTERLAVSPSTTDLEVR
jgi:hypothetical protein